MNELTTISQLSRLVELIKGMGIEVRQELLDGKGAAICQIKGKPCLFLDLSCGPAEQMEAIRNAVPDIAK